MHRKWTGCGCVALALLKKKQKANCGDEYEEMDLQPTINENVSSERWHAFSFFYANFATISNLFFLYVVTYSTFKFLLLFNGLSLLKMCVGT